MLPHFGCGPGVLGTASLCAWGWLHADLMWAFPMLAPVLFCISHVPLGNDICACVCCICSSAKPCKLHA
jgi:hypothetical protein